MSNSYADSSNALTNEYNRDSLISGLRHYAAVTTSFLESLTVDQLLMVNDLEITCMTDETSAANKARNLLKNYPWPEGLSTEAMDYDLFNKHFVAGVVGETALYYYVFDKCIERRGRNKNKTFMARLATFAKASFRELWEESQKWTVEGMEVTLEPNKVGSKKEALLPYRGSFAADHIIKHTDDNGKCITALAEEKPCFAVDDAIKKYKDPKTRYQANYLMLYLVPNNTFYIHNYMRNKTSEMIPEKPFPGYPNALKNIDNL